MADLSPGASAPVVPVTPAADAAPAPDATAVPGAEPVGDKPVVPDRVFTQKEVDEINAKTRAQAEKRAMRIARAEAEAAIYKRLAEERQNPQSQAQRLEEPKPEDFQGNYEGYLRALAKYDRQVEREQEQREQQQRHQQVNAQQADVEFARSFNSKVEAASEKHPDIRDKLLEVSDSFTPPMIAALDQLPDGLDIAYHLANTNPKELSRIAKLAPIPQVIAFYEAGKKLAEPPKPTNAPPPIVPNQTKAATDKDWEQLTDKEFAERRRRQIAQRR